MADDTIPLVSHVRTVDTAWNVYIGGSIQVRETNAGLIQIRTEDTTTWTTVGTKAVY